MKVIYKEEKHGTIDINDCTDDYIYVFEDNPNTIFVLKYDKEDLWYFTSMEAGDHHHYFKNSTIQLAIQEAMVADYEVYCFTGAIEFYEWTAGKS